MVFDNGGNCDDDDDDGDDDDDDGDDDCVEPCAVHNVQLTDNNGFWKQEFFIWKADTDIVTIICAVRVEMIHLHFNP